jgi:hypothetical protein
MIRMRALSDFDGVFLPDFGTQHPPANYLSRYARWSSIVMKSSAKDAGPVAASFEPMCLWFGLHLSHNATNSSRGIGFVKDMINYTEIIQQLDKSINRDIFCDKNGFVLKLSLFIDLDLFRS